MKAGFRNLIAVFLTLAYGVTSCDTPRPDLSVVNTPSPSPTTLLSATPFPTRPHYAPGELVDYVAQNGDTLPALAAHFNTTVAEIREANPEIPADATTMPPGMPMKIPIYYLPFWGTPFQIIPDSHYVNGPAVIGFDTSAFVAGHPGWLKDYVQYAGGENRTGAQMVDYVATNFSISPRLLLALLEYEAGALSQPQPSSTDYLLGYPSYYYRGVYMQLVWAANMLNQGYYGWRSGLLTEFEHPDGRLERPDPWQNAATVALQYYFSRTHDQKSYETAIGPDGIALTYRRLFGDPWKTDVAHIPVSLQQPSLLLPFPSGQTWSFTSGPHNPWGQEALNPLAALDFAPPALIGGCQPSDLPTVAVADGVVARLAPGILVLDLDGDGDERTGWAIFYLHVATAGRAELRRWVRAGEPLGYPSCEGGIATGTHIHIARKYNGEWILADGAIPFNLEGWIAQNGEAPRRGTLKRGARLVIACDCSAASAQITAGK